jgi:hypothetical protein
VEAELGGKNERAPAGLGELTLEVEDGALDAKGANDELVNSRQYRHELGTSTEGGSGGCRRLHIAVVRLGME